jgi:hypothetical protein
VSRHLAAPAGPWYSHPGEWHPLLDDWSRMYPGCVRLHEWEQVGGQKVRGLTLGDDGQPRPVRLLVTVPHAHEPAPTAAIVNLAGELLREWRWDIQYPGSQAGGRFSFGLLRKLLITLLPDTNSQGRARSPRRGWDGELDNEEFLKIAFGEAGDGERFGRYPEWRWEEHRPRRVGIVYEEIEPGVWVEPNTSHRSTHSRAIDTLLARYRYTHYLEMHQHEGDEAALLPADLDEFPSESQAQIGEWSDAVLRAWEAAEIVHKGSYVPYPGQPRQQLFRHWWAGRCPGMLRLSTETRNNRHVTTGEPTPLDRQFRSAETALEATLQHLAALE